MTTSPEPRVIQKLSFDDLECIEYVYVGCFSCQCSSRCV